MDSYKIVSTQEKRGIYFTVVPSQWEKNGILYWPEHLAHSPREKLRSNAASVPDIGWSEYPCVVKITGISTFQDALKIEKQLTQCIDTDAEESLFLDMHVRKRAKNTIKQAVGLVSDRNDLFAEYSGNSTSLLPEEIGAAASVAEPVIPQLNQQEFIVLGTDGNVDLNNILNAETPNVWEQINLMKNELNNFRSEFATFKSDIKLQIKEDYSKMSVNLDQIFRMLSNQNQPRAEVTVPNPTPNLLQNVKFPLASCEEISRLEEQVRNNVEFRRQLVKKNQFLDDHRLNTLLQVEFLSNIGGRTGQEDGSKIAYKVVDSVFKSEILMLYSWTGVSRGTSGEKKAFQMLDGILGVFFEVISMADNRHTMKKNCTIFKDGVLKHAKKRSARKRTKPNSDDNVDNNNTNITDDSKNDEHEDIILQDTESENTLEDTI